MFVYHLVHLAVEQDAPVEAYPYLAGVCDRNRDVGGSAIVGQRVVPLGVRAQVRHPPQSGWLGE